MLVWLPVRGTRLQTKGWCSGLVYCVVGQLQGSQKAALCLNYLSRYCSWQLRDCQLFASWQRAGSVSLEQRTYYSYT